MANVGIVTGVGANMATDSGTRDTATENVQIIRQDNTLLATYFASSTALAGVSGIFFLLTGNTTTVTKLRRVLVSGVATTGAFFDLTLTKYTTAASGGTAGTTPTIGLMDPNNASSHATLATYTAAPTPGTSGGIVAVRKILLPASATVTYLSNEVNWIFSEQDEQCPTLRTASQQLGLTLSAAPTGGSIDVTFVWSEETNSF